MKKKTLISALLILLSFLPFMGYCTSIPPSDKNDSTEYSYDRANAMGNQNLTLYDNVIGAYDSVTWKREWAKSGWVCTDQQNRLNGICDKHEIVDNSTRGETTIQLVFTEQRSHIQTMINIKAWNYGIYPAACSEGQDYSDYQINSVTAPHCPSANLAVSGRELNAYIPASEMAKIPFGGIWKAQMVLEYRGIVTPDNIIHLATWTKHITLNVTDNNNQQIYLPEFGQAAPRVDLNLRPLPGTGGNQAQMTGRANIDMCLYDGYGSNSSSFTLKFEDQPQGSSSHSSGNFFIYTDHGDVNQSSGWIEYFVGIVLPDGNTESIMRGHDIVIPDIQNAHVRPVHLPGIPQAVLCVPMPIELDTKAIDINSKQAGHYTGHLIVTFTSQL
ncbi:CfaE/CblD family pilus tip adhesin [Rahnella aquatilis]|uniref:CfaE/CblD family pilus tip adhesin n=1 Tax=Rahnella aquatilis TaxID=34038 RepID=UPI0006457355|nr:CfaE/CblD family pilus tip adhesin [Rahnella aquatilis]